MLLQVTRTDDVIQFRVAAVSDKFDMSLCNDDRLVLDKWIVVDRANLGRRPQICPLKGGFNVGLYDKVRRYKLTAFFN